MNAKEELKTLQSFAQIGKTFRNNDLEHLDAPMGAFNYIRMADSISKHAEKFWPESQKTPEIQANKNHKFLDWGAGYGQITWLLRNRGINATGFNIEERENVNAIPELAKLPMVTNSDPIKLPFKDNSFIGVSSCGVLEHVQNPEASLQEIHRILMPNGYFYLFMLPQQTAWVETLSEWRGISVHPIRYTIKKTTHLLERHGFEIKKLWKFNLIPKNLTGLPYRIKILYGKMYPLLYPLDKALSYIPLLNLLSGVIEGVAQKK